MWFEGQMVGAMAEQFNIQRDQILAHLDISRIGKTNGKKIYTRKDWLQDLLDWAAAADSFSEAIKSIIHATLLQAGRDATLWGSRTLPWRLIRGFRLLVRTG
jgi:hypothetical protein